MISQKQLLANRQNALRSTGPRTEAGKSIASQNAIRHGLRAENTVIPGEDAEEFNELRQLLLDDLDPEGPLEVCLSDRIILGFWKLRRAGCIETEILSDLHRDLVKQHQRRQEQIEADEQRRLEKLALQQEYRDPPEGPSDYEKTLAAWEGSEQAQMIRENRWPADPGHPTPEEAMKTFIRDHSLQLRQEHRVRLMEKISLGLVTIPGMEPQAPQESCEPHNPEPPGMSQIFQKDITGSRILNWFHVYEGRIERSLYKALTELQKLRILRSGCAMIPVEEPVEAPGPI